MLAQTMRNCLMMSSTLDSGKNVQLARYVVVLRLLAVRNWQKCDTRDLIYAFSLMAGVS